MALEIEDLMTRYARVYTGAVSDVLDQLNERHQVLPSSLRGLTPDAKVVGRALPVVGGPTSTTDADTIFVPILTMLGDVKSYDVVIIQARDTGCAHLGELSATAIKARGGAGAVVYGGVRDVDYIRRLGLDVFCLYTTPSDVVGRWQLLAYNEPIDIEGVTICPHDIVLGDADGVVVIPEALAEEVLIRAEAIVYTENHVREAVKKGVHPLQAYRQYGWF